MDCSGSGNTSNTARGLYTKLTSAQRLMIGKRASEHGTTLAILHSTALRQLQSRGQVRNKRNNDTVVFAKVFSPITLEMRFHQKNFYCQSFCLYGNNIVSDFRSLVAKDELLCIHLVEYIIRLVGCGPHNVLYH